jgi:hypothetical protein
MIPEGRDVYPALTGAGDNKHQVHHILLLHMTMNRNAYVRKKLKGRDRESLRNSGREKKWRQSAGRRNSKGANRKP